MRRSKLGTALALALVMLTPQFSQAQEEPAGLRASLELELRPDLLDLGTTRLGWTPCEVLVTNLGLRRSLELHLTLHVGPSLVHSVRRRVELSPDQSRRLWFLVPVQAGTHRVGVEARELSEGGVAGRLLATAQRDLDVVDDSYNYRYGRYSRLLYVRDRTQQDDLDDPLNWLGGGGQGRWSGARREVGWRPPAELPVSPFAYDGVDMVVLHGVDCGQFDRAQADALLAWVETGGRVLLIPGELNSWFEQPFLRQLIGRQWFRGETFARLPLLTTHYRPRPPRASDAQLFLLQTRPFAEEDLELITGTWWNSAALPAERPLRRVPRFDEQQARVPLAYDFARGQGRAYVLALDPSSAGFRHWGGRSAFFDSVVHWTDVNRAPRWRSKHDHLGDLRVRPELIESLDSRHRPSRLFVLSMVLSYILCVGPLNYWVMGRRDQRHKLVLTVPLLSLVFTLAVFAVGFAVGGLSSVVWRVSVVEGQLGKRWGWERTAVSVLSALEQEHRVELDPALAATRVFRGEDKARTASGDHLLAGDAVVYPAVSLAMWEQAYFEGQRVLDLGAGVRLERSGDGLRLVNDSPLTLERGLLFEGDMSRPFPTGPLAPGESALLRERLPERPSGPGIQARVPSSGLYGRRELAAQLFPGDDDLIAHCVAALDVYSISPPISDGGPALLIGLLAGPTSRVAVDGEAAADRALDLVVLRERP